MDSSIPFHNPRRPTQVTHNRVPHWEQNNSTYFITYRLADSIPAEVLNTYMAQKRHWLAAAPEKPWSEAVSKDYRKRFTGRFERWLDRGYGCCLLADRANADIVRNSLDHFDGERYRLHSWVIMPNHVHILASIHEPFTLGQTLKTWKGFSARQVNKRMNLSGPVWQKSYFDRSIRDEEHFRDCAMYIRTNPTKAQVQEGRFLLGESDLIRSLLA